MASPTYRVSLSESELVAIATLIHEARQKGLSRELASASVKISNLLTKAELGLKTPDYVATGRKPAAISLDGLGATPKEKEYAHMSQEEQEAELERLEREMLLELKEQGHDVVVPERRVGEDRRNLSSAVNYDDTTPEPSNDNALFEALNS